MKRFFAGLFAALIISACTILAIKVHYDLYKDSRGWLAKRKDQLVDSRFGKFLSTKTSSAGKKISKVFHLNRSGDVETAETSPTN